MYVADSTASATEYAQQDEQWPWFFTMLTHEGYPMASILSDESLVNDNYTVFEYMCLDFVQQDIGV